MVISEAGKRPKGFAGTCLWSRRLCPDENQSAKRRAQSPYSPPPGPCRSKSPNCRRFSFPSVAKESTKTSSQIFRPAERAIVYATQGSVEFGMAWPTRFSVPAWTTKTVVGYIAVNDRMLFLPNYEQAIAKHIHATTTNLFPHRPCSNAVESRREVAAVIIEAANTPLHRAPMLAERKCFISVFPASFPVHQEIQADGATIHVRVGGEGPSQSCLLPRIRRDNRR